MQLAHRWDNLRISPSSILSLSPDGKHLVATIGRDSSVIFVDVEEGRFMHLTHLDPGVSVTSILWKSPEELFVATSDRMLVLLSLKPSSIYTKTVSPAIGDLPAH